MSACCGGSREKEEKISDTHKWDYINLSDFKSTSCLTPLSYGVLYITFLISIAAYIADIFVAINLLAFNKWAGQIQPVLDLKYTRWIFAGCIILSLVLLVYRWIRAVRAIRTGGIARSYLDPMAVGLQSIRMGKRGRGWRRFLVFAELTKSKKGVEYIALFTYFSFESWIRVVFAEGPRKVINAMTLYSIYQKDFTAVDNHDGDNPVSQFFNKLKQYTDDNNLRAAITFSMIFTLLLWILAALSLIASCLFYLLFLWHHIPSQDGGLRKYCKRKIDSRLQKIVDAKVKKAIAKEDRKLGLAPTKDADIKRQPTVPVLAGDDAFSSHGPRSSFGSINSNRQDIERQADLGQHVTRPPFLTRMTTNSSTTSANSYSSNAPLIGTAGPMGSAAPPGPYSPDHPSPYGNARSVSDNRLPLNRSFTGQTSSSQSTTMRGRPQMGPGPPQRLNTGLSDYTPDAHSLISPLSPAYSGPSSSQRSDGRITPGQPQRPGTGMSGYGGNYFPPTSYPRQINGPSSIPHNGRGSPAPDAGSVQEFEMRAQTPSSTNRSAQSNTGGFMAYNPSMNTSAPSQRSFTGPPPRSFTSSPARNFSSPAHLPDNYRAGTVSPESAANASYDASIYDSYRSH